MADDYIQLNPDVKEWSRRTAADGMWLNDNTIKPIKQHISAFSGFSAYIDDKVDGEIDARIDGDEALASALNSKIDSSEKGANGGVATLGNDGKVPASQLPDIGISLSAGTDLKIENNVVSIDTDGTIGTSAEMCFVAGSGTHVEGTGAAAFGVSTVATGHGAFAEGFATTAAGSDSHAEGYATDAVGGDSHTEGAETYAYGFASHAEGGQTTAIGSDSHAEGFQTLASGAQAHAEGASSFAGGSYSHTEGYGTSAVGYASHAEGNSAIASGHTSHAEGYVTSAFGSDSHSEGCSSKALGDYSHAEGGGTSAYGEASHTEGSGTHAGFYWEEKDDTQTVTASGYAGNYSHAEGYGTSAVKYASHAEGYFAIASGRASHAEGGGTSANGEDSHAEGGGTLASGDYSHAEGLEPSAVGNNSHAEGYHTLASSIGTHTEGSGTLAIGIYSHAEGIESYTFAEGAHAEGCSDASGKYSHAEGYGTSSVGYASHAEGGGIAVGSNSHAEGGGTSAVGDYSHAEGGGTSAVGDVSHAEGEFTIAGDEAMHVGGKYNSTSANAAFVIGNGISTANRSDAFVIDWNGNVSAAGKISANGVELNAQINADWEATSGVAEILNKPQNLVQDASYVHTDNNYTTADKNKLAGIANGAEVNVQSDWNQASSAADDYIKNKPTVSRYFNKYSSSTSVYGWKIGSTVTRNTNGVSSIITGVFTLALGINTDNAPQESASVKTKATMVGFFSCYARYENGANVVKARIYTPVSSISDSTFNLKYIDEGNGKITWVLGFGTGTTPESKAYVYCSVNVLSSVNADFENFGDAITSSPTYGNYFTVFKSPYIPQNTSGVGSTTKPVYVNENGTVTECNNYGGGTAVTLNGSSKAADTASFYAPTAAGAAGKVLKSNGSSAPTWGDAVKYVTSIDTSTMESDVLYVM